MDFILYIKNPFAKPSPTLTKRQNHHLVQSLSKPPPPPPPPSLGKTNPAFPLFSFPMASSSSSLIISPRKLRSDLYSYSYQEDSSTPSVINVLASLIERNMARTERIVKNCSWALSKAISTNIFDCREIPDMTIQSYLERIFRYTRAWPSVYVVAYVYIDRFCQNNPGFRINSRNVHRLLITTIMVASKYVEDMNYRNSYFARVGGLTTNELNKLELEFLFLMGFKLHVNVSVFESYCCHLEREVSIGGGYHIERTLRCAEEIKARHREERSYNQIARVML